MFISKRLLERLKVHPPRADRYLSDLNVQLPEHEIDTPLRVAHFLAQVLHESMRMKVLEENLRYSAERLLQVFPKYFRSEEADAYAFKPERIGSRVYANRLGNGDESSGDGYRYRGRGLIQLTGKENYERFAAWIGEDVVAQPNLVASRYAVHSAVYFWSSRELNALADTDDVSRVTKRVNGGYNGLSERIALLDKAKEGLARELAPPSLDGVTHTVNATRLNFRTEPIVADHTRMGSLNQGTRVKRISDAEVEGWVKVRAVLNGRIAEGFVADRYLSTIRRAPATEIDLEPPDPFAIPPVHLARNLPNIIRVRDGGRAYPLGEPDRPSRTGTKPETKVAKLIEIVRYLDSENEEHRRYRAKKETTYCNIYAYDYCFLCGVYMPRVWWKEHALEKIRADFKIPVQYGMTVHELNANMLQDWFEDYAPAFGWKRVFTLDELQASANNGEVCVIVAQHQNVNSPGHITAVVPEHAEFEASRDRGGKVLRPLESQAGRQNHRFFAKSKAWWVDAEYHAFSFWRHA